MKVTENQKLTNTVVLFKFFMKFSSISSESESVRLWPLFMTVN